jgi:hypothetical protein
MAIGQPSLEWLLLALSGGSPRCGKSSVIESAADDLLASSAPPPLTHLRHKCSGFSAMHIVARPPFRLTSFPVLMGLCGKPNLA